MKNWGQKVFEMSSFHNNNTPEKVCNNFLKRMFKCPKTQYPCTLCISSVTMGSAVKPLMNI